MKRYWPFAAAALLVVVVQVVLGAWIWYRFGAPQDAAAFGDMFGSVNTLFAGLAFAGVIYAIVLQQQELALQRQELAETRRELSRSAEAQEKSEEALREQVDVAKQQAEAVYRPYVSVRLAPTPTGNSLRLVIVNEGRTAAQNLRLSLTRDFHPVGFGTRSKTMNLANRHAFRNSIKSFPPGASLEFPVADLVGHRFREPEEPMLNARLRFAVEAVYEFPGRTIEETTDVDLQPYLESEPPVSDPVGRALEKVAQSLANMEPKSSTSSKEFDQSKQNALFDKLTAAVANVANETKALGGKIDKLSGGSSSDPTPRALGTVASEIKNVQAAIKARKQ